MDLVLSRTTAGDAEVRRLVAAQEVEVASRYDTVDVGPQPAAGTEQPEAVQLYRSAGWTPIPCYGWFADDPTTRCFERVLADG